VSQDLRAYLKSLSTPGEFDSEGQFTVDVHKRNIKLRDNRFLDSTYYLLCCVRAAVTSESEQVLIRLKRSSTLVVFKNPKKLRAEDIVESVLGSTSHSATDHLLAAALQGGLAAGASRVRAKLRNSELKFTQDSLRVKAKDSDNTNVTLSFDFLAGSRSSRKKRCLEESQAVLSRCAFCPVPIMMGGLSVVDNDGWESLLRWQRADEGYGVHPDFVWLEAFLPEAKAKFHSGVSRRKCRVEYVGGERYKTSDWDPREPNSFLRIVPKARGKRNMVGTFVRLGSALEGPGQLYLVKQGVTMDPVEEYLGAPGVAVVVRGDEFETDASLFKPILDDESGEKLLRGIRAEVKALAVQLGRERKSFTFQPRDQGALLKKAGLCGTGGALFGLLAGPTGAFVLGGTLFFLGGFFALWQDTDQRLVEAEQRVRWELDAFVNSVAPEDDGKTRL
jgi:hypothetical protein